MDGVLIQERVNTIVNGDQAQETDEDVQDHKWVQNKCERIILWRTDFLS